MQYIQKYATEDQITKKFKYTETVGDAYFDERGILKPGHCNKFEVGHFSLLALMEWGQQNTYVKKKMYNKYRLRFITHNTVFNYEIQTLVSMMHWDEFNKTWKFAMIMNSLKNRGTTFEEQCKKAESMKKEQDRLFQAEFKSGMRYGRKFHATVCIQRWWLRKKRKFRIYKNIYQLMDEYSIEGGFTKRDSAKYLGIGRGKYILNIQEDIMNKVLARRLKCKEVSKNFIKTVFRDVFYRQLEHTCYKKIEDITVYGFGSSSRWAKDGGTEPYLCASCATTDHMYPGGGRASDSLMHPRWEAQCYKCWKKNPYYKIFERTSTHCYEMLPPPTPPPSPCDRGPIGDKGPKSLNGGWWGRWLRRLGLTK
jgi:hypothetical protein